MNTTKTNKIAEVSTRPASRAANLATTTTLTDAWSALTDEQKTDFTNNAGDYRTVTVAISLAGTSARLVTDDWHEENGEGNDAAREHLNGLETPLNDTDSDAQYMGELRDGADPEGDKSYRPLYHTRTQINQARESYQKALTDTTAPLATN